MKTVIGNRKTAMALLVASMVGCGTMAEASVTFTLQNVAFNDGTSAAGSFTTDDGFTAITDFSIQTQAGSLYQFGNQDFPTTIAGDLYSPATSTASIMFNGVQFVDERNFFTRSLYLVLPKRFRNVTTMLDGRSTESAFLSFRQVTGGSVLSSVVPAVPEPATWTMLIFGFGLAGVGLRRASAPRYLNVV